MIIFDKASINKFFFIGKKVIIAKIITITSIRFFEFIQ